MHLSSLTLLLGHLIAFSSGSPGGFGYNCGRTKWSEPYMLSAACWSNSKAAWVSASLDLNLCYVVDEDGIKPRSKYENGKLSEKKRDERAHMRLTSYSGTAFKTYTSCSIQGSTLTCDLGSKEYSIVELSKFFSTFFFMDKK